MGSDYLCVTDSINRTLTTINMAKKEINTDGIAIEVLYDNIKRVVDKARGQAYHAANFAMVESYWQIGKLIVEEEQQGEHRAEYGKKIIKQLAQRLMKSSGRGFNERNLWYMKQFYQTWPIVNALRSQLSWTHYRLLLKTEREDARLFYMQEAIDGNWSTRTMERQINSLYYERMVMTPEVGKALVKAEAESKKEAIEAKHIIKDPYVLDFLELKANSNFYEQELEQAIIDKLQEFLLELGKGFSFVSRQYRVSLEGDHFFIDLVFYNYILKCFLLIDLKTGKLSHQDVGQMDMYVRIFEEKMRQESDNPTIGLILCSEKNNAVAKYSLLNDSKQVFASKYKTYLPTEQELQEEIIKEREAVEMEKQLE
jgi:predicted nuclease of restriction endonuclease-like (RecB) superfamily